MDLFTLNLLAGPLWGGAVLLLLFVMFFPTGSLCLSALLSSSMLQRLSAVQPKLPRPITFLIALPLGMLVVSGIVTSLRMFFVPTVVVQLILYSIIAFAAALWWGRLRVATPERRFWKISQIEAVSLICLWLFTSVCLLGASFPSGNPEDLMVHVVMGLTSLPVDALIPYLVSRYLVEGVSFGAAPVLPDWNVTDRPPLASMIVTSVFTLAGISDSGPLYGATRGVYFLAHVVEMYLNALPICSLWLIGAHYFSRRQAAMSVLLGVVTSFFYQNVIFTWPKFFAAHLLLIGLVILVYERQFLLSGVLMGMAALAHGVALFYVVGLFCLWGTWLLISRGRSRGGFGFAALLICAAGYLVTLAPWKIVSAYFPPTPRLTFLHLFCDMSQDMSNKVFWTELRRYLTEHTLAELLLVRWGNLLYSFDLNPGLTALQKLALSEPAWGVFDALDGLSKEAFYRLIWAIGPLSLLSAVIAALVCAWREKRYEPGIILSVSLVALLVAVASFGCANWAMNHHWSYGMYITLALFAGIFCAGGSVLGLVFFAVSFPLNVIWLLYHGLYKNEIVAFAYTETPVIIAQGVLLLCFCAVFLAYLLREEHDGPA